VREARRRRRREKVLQADRRGMPLYNLLFWEKVVENQRRGGVCFRFLVTTSIGKGTKKNPKERKKKKNATGDAAAADASSRPSSQLATGASLSSSSSSLQNMIALDFVFTTCSSL